MVFQRGAKTGQTKNQSFKLEVVQSFLTGDGAKLLARRWSLPKEIRTWVSHCRLHVIERLRPKRRAYSVQFKLQAWISRPRRRQSPCGESTAA